MIGKTGKMKHILNTWCSFSEHCVVFGTLKKEQVNVPEFFNSFMV
jgi:hypothetical protein